MKEATGELSMTAVVVVIIGILAVAMPIVIKGVMSSMEKRTLCANAYACTGTGQTQSCTYNVENGDTCHDGSAPTGATYECSIVCENPDYSG